MSEREFDEDISDNDDESITQKTRERKPTEKGREYHLQVAYKNYRTAFKRWRRQLNRAETALLDIDELQTLRTERNNLDVCFNELTIEYERINDKGDDEIDETTALEFDQSEEDTHRVCKALNNRIADLLIDDRSSERSSTNRARRSNRSASSSTSRTRLADVTVKAARLKAELKFHQLESAKMIALKRQEEEMEKLRLEKELAITKAEIEALNRVKDEETESVLSQKIDDDTDDKDRILQNYLDDQLKNIDKPNTEVTKGSPSNDDPENLNPDDPRPRTEDLPEHQGTEDDFDEDKGNPTKDDPENTNAEHQRPRTEDTPEHRSINDNSDRDKRSAVNKINDNDNTDGSGQRTAEHTDSTSEEIDTHESKNGMKLKDNLNNKEPTTDFQASQLPPTQSLPSTNTDPLTRLADLLSQRQERDQLPRPEPDVFDGNLLRFPLWMKSFETLVESRTYQPSERLYYLGKYTSGEAKEAVSGLLPLSGNDAYLEAKKLLQERYGNPFLVSDAYRKKINDWPRIPANDGPSLRKLADFLEHCKSAMKEIKYLAILDDPEENQKILRKLPNYLVTRWGRTVDQWLTKDDEGGYPPFSEFCHFLKTEARIACNPVTAMRQMRNNDEATKVRHSTPLVRRQPSATSFATAARAATPEGSRDVKQTKCSMCAADHELDICREFLQLSLKERKDHARSKALCWGCLRYGHKSKQCRKKKTCKVCEGNHPSSLHDDTFKPKAEASRTPTATTEAISNRISMNTESQADPITSHSLIVPVLIKHPEKPHNECLTYALLDEQSDACFIKDSTLQQIGVNGPEINISLSTVLGRQVISSRRISGLIVRGVNEEHNIQLPKVYTRDEIPAKRSRIPRPETAAKWPHLRHISNQLMPYREDMEIGILIGLNCTRAIKPCQLITGKGDEPYGKKTALGWGIVGVVNKDAFDDNPAAFATSIVRKQVENPSQERSFCQFAFQTRTKEIFSPHDVLKMFNSDFNDKETGERSLSIEDKAFLKIAEEGIHQLTDGHFELPLPFRNKGVLLDDNREMAMRRLLHLKKRFEGSDQYRQDYTAFMNEIIDNGHAERVPDKELSLPDGSVWYIPHHAVYHPKKQKIRVVFDCSASFKGQSLNKQLLQGPDLTNSLVGVLLRFRLERVALMCDISKMFHQVMVNPECRDFLRFLWWERGDTKEIPTTYRMKVHLFGAVSSPGCANFTLKKVADTYEREFGHQAADFVRDNFYVDDGLTSVQTNEEAITLIESTKALCSKSGFTLHKFSSNSKAVIETIPPHERALDVQDIEDDKGSAPAIDRALGVQWCIESDTFQFRITLKDRPFTRRGVLATVSSVFDPLGLVAPVILPGKKILQSLCQQNVDWDEKVPDDIRPKWERWRADLHNLSQLKIRRCYQPEEFGTLKTVEMHHFSDASNEGYGQCSYIRLVDDSNRVHCSLVMAKARVTPLKPVTIPRLELSAALVSVRISQMIQREMSKLSLTDIFWTDSKVALGYINNEERRFHAFVGNRVRQIRDSSSPEQWHYVATDQNPADHASRGLTAKQLVDCNMWWNGPEFLQSTSFVMSASKGELREDDPEVRRVQSFSAQATVTVKYASLLPRLEYFSDWYRAKRAVAHILRLQHRFKGSPSKNTTPRLEPLTVKDLQRAELCIIKELQQENFKEECSTLASSVKKTSSLHRLDPFLDQDELLRVGGRLKLADVSYEEKHPLILPRKSHVTDLILCESHEKARHQGRGITQSEIRASGYWIIGGQSVVAYHISNCVKCRKLRSTTLEQKMADLPTDRVQPAPPFTYAGVDCFGPFIVKDRRKEIKRYGVLFTCLVSRAIHIEVANNMDADSFLNAYRRFIGRRGPVRHLRSDQGTNFIGARNELKKALEELDVHKVKETLLRDNCDWIILKTNVPHASHMGGVWERQIRSVRNVLNALLEHHSTQLDDESLTTLMVEAEAIVNSRPLTTESASSPGNLHPLTPNQLLTMKSKVLLPPPGSFERPDLYSRKRWRRVQHLANEFWLRWRKEYLQTLQQRHRWTKPRRNLQLDDIVLLADDETLPRNKWRLARVSDVYPDEDGRVRKVQIVMANQYLDKHGKRTKPSQTLQRPIQKLVLLVAREETGEVPIEEPPDKA